MKNHILLRSGKKLNKNLFLIHAGNGEIQNYIAFSSYVHPDISCWAIRANRFADYKPVNTTIQEMAKDYVKIIKSIQPIGPYYIAGWCFGGVRAFEIALQLESDGEKVDFLTIFNSHVPTSNSAKKTEMIKKYAMLDTDIPRFDYKSEIQIIQRWLLNIDSNWIGTGNLKYDDIWSAFIDDFKDKHIVNDLIETIKRDIPEDRALAIPYYNDISLEKLIYYLAVMRTDAKAQAFYKPDGKLMADTFYFGARDSLIENRNSWSDYTSKPIVCNIVDGDHFSIFKSDNVGQLAEKFNDELIKYI